MDTTRSSGKTLTDQKSNVTTFKGFTSKEETMNEEYKANECNTITTSSVSTADNSEGGHNEKSKLFECARDKSNSFLLHKQKLADMKKKGQLLHVKIHEETCAAKTKNESTLSQTINGEAANTIPSRSMVGKVIGEKSCPKLGGGNLSCDSPRSECQNFKKLTGCLSQLDNVQHAEPTNVVNSNTLEEVDPEEGHGKGKLLLNLQLPPELGSRKM